MKLWGLAGVVVVVVVVFLLAHQRCDRELLMAKPELDPSPASQRLTCWHLSRRSMNNSNKYISITIMNMCKYFAMMCVCRFDIQIFWEIKQIARWSAAFRSVFTDEIKNVKNGGLNKNWRFIWFLFIKTFIFFNQSAYSGRFRKN